MNPLEKLNSDESVFNFVKQHLIHQGKKSMQFYYGDCDGDVKCLYRGKDNLKCAIGCLIKDEFYTEDMEEKGIIDLFVQNIVSQSLPNWKPNWNLLSALQEIHDEFEIESWEKQLELVHQKYIVEKEIVKAEM